MVPNICLPTPPPTLKMGPIGQNSTFLEYVAYQIKGNHECTNMVANILSADPSTPNPIRMMRSIGLNSTFSEHDHAYQIKWNHKI